MINLKFYEVNVDSAGINCYTVSVIVVYFFTQHLKLVLRAGNGQTADSVHKEVDMKSTATRYYLGKYSTSLHLSLFSGIF